MRRADEVADPDARVSGRETCAGGRAAQLDLFFHDASAVSTDERAGNARARELLSDHAFSPPHLAAPMIARAAAGCRRLPP